MEQFKRHVAYKASIAQLLGSKFIKEADLSYLLIGDRRVSRVNIIGIVVGVDDAAVILDDGSSRIALRTFGESLVFNGAVGDSVLVVGRPREFDNDRYIVPEIISKIDSRWMAVRKLELKLIPEAEKTYEESEVIRETIDDDTSTKVYNLIKSLDEGEGVEVERVISGIESAEKIISNLLKEGEIFEIRPGRVKVLE
ncbi:MAG TPA: hypothetical protein VJI46_02885 [Candidatus Nanoarchaeia archaeon]|nr:hypothetical protein [Candidatus Nanoarchaeia archaeon]